MMTYRNIETRDFIDRFIGLAEALIALTGKHHGERGGGTGIRLKIVRRIREFCDEQSLAV